MIFARNWPLTILHFLLAIGTPVVLVLVVGCMKAKEKKEELGPEFSYNTIKNTLIKMGNNADLSKLAVGQYIALSDTRRIENSDSVITIGARKVEVIDKQDLGTQLKFTTRITNAERQSDGSFKTSIGQDEIVVDKPTAAILASVHAKAVAGDVTFHHLRESDGVVAMPDAVRARANCSGISPCELPVHIVQFEMVEWKDAANYQKVSFDLTFSYVTPYLPFGDDIFTQLNGALISDCRSTYIPVANRTVYVRDCLTVEDFQK